MSKSNNIKKIKTIAKSLVLITLCNGETLQASPDHIFYNERQEYVTAQNITSSSLLLNKDGDIVPVCVSFLKKYTYDIDCVKWNKIFQDWSQGNGAFLYEHIFVGKVSGNNIQGVHHSTALTTNTSNFQVNDIRITPGTKVQKGGGFYEAVIEYWDGAQWIQKTENGVVVKNGFFPDNWTNKQVMEEVSYARSKVTVNDWIFYNNYNGYLKDGQKLLLYIGSAPPPPMPNWTISIFPVF